MELASLIAQFRAQTDPEARSQVLEEIAHSHKSTYKPEVVNVLIEALGDDDPVVQEWATVALRKLKDNSEAVRAMWDCFTDERRESLRCWAVVGLGKMGQHLSALQLKALYDERRPAPDDLLLAFAIHWCSKASTDPAVLKALLEINDAEEKRTPPDPYFQNLTRAAALRCARYCLAANTVTKQWLRKHGARSLLDKLGETRIERLIAQERAKRQQPSFGLPELAESDPDAPLLPGRALADAQDDQYAQDLVEWKNIRIVETRSYVRDQHLARQTKKDMGDACQVCGDQLAARALSRRFVHAHHVEPLSQGGADAGKNLIVLCPSCHARLHAGEIQIHVATEGRPVSWSAHDSERRPLLRSDASQDPQAARQRAAYAQVICLLDRLGAEQLEALAQLLGERIASAARDGKHD